MSLEDTKHSPFQRQRNILYLISQYLSDYGLKQTKSTLWNEAALSTDCKVCDNIDLDTIYLDFCSYYHLRFAKLPKILRRVENDSNDASSSRVNKSNKLKCSDSSVKMTEECTKKVNKELRNDFVVTGSVASNDDASEGINKTRPQKSMDLMEPFPGELRDLAHIIERQIVKKDYNIKWTDVQGNEHAKQILNESVVIPLKYPHLFNDLTKPWTGVLFHGVTGVGKTLLAKALSSETFGTVTFFNISASVLISKWRGESEKFAKILFTMARSCAPAIIFIDEFESLASKRDSPNDHEATKRFKNELLIQIDDLDMANGNVLLLANSNLPWEIDEAFLRRFERKVLIDLPNAESRAKIINQLIPITRDWPSSQIQLMTEASDGFTGADLKIACKEASMIQIRNKLKSSHKTIHKVPEIAFEDLLAVLKQVKPSMATSAAKHRQWNAKYGNQSG